jgi:hypothetical protein
MNDISFFYYPADVTIPKPLGKVTFKQFLRANKNPSPDISGIFEQISDATNAGDVALKAKLKSKLYYFTPCVTTDGLGRSYTNITGFTGLMVLDFDKLDNAPAFKQFLFDAIPSIVAAYLSPSKKGCKFIVKIPVCKTTDEFKSYFYGMAHFLEKYEGFDPSTQNCILPLYLSIDPDLLYRDNAETWTKRGMKLDEFKVHVGEIEVLENVTEKEKDSVRRILTNLMSKIVDSGHYIVRSTALCGGGYAASGYLTQEEVEDIIFNEIDNNSYLQKNIRGYKMTAKDMIAKGMKSPLYLRNE